jgi:hypothetical protein
MKQPPVTYDTVRPVALALPQVEERTSSRTPAVKGQPEAVRPPAPGLGQDRRQNALRPPRSADDRRS